MAGAPDDSPIVNDVRFVGPTVMIFCGLPAHALVTSTTTQAFCGPSKTGYGVCHVGNLGTLRSLYSSESFASGGTKSSIERSNGLNGSARERATQQGSVNSS